MLTKFENLFLDNVVELSQESEKLGRYIEHEIDDELDLGIEDKPCTNFFVAFKAYNELYISKFDNIVSAIVAEMEKLDDETLDEINHLIHEDGDINWNPLRDKLNELTMNMYGQKFY